LDPIPDFVSEITTSENIGPHEYGGAFKLYIREAPEPPVPYSFWQTFIDAIQKPNPEQQLIAVREALIQLPSENLLILKTIFVYFRKVTIFSIKNKMDAKNLGMIFGPTVLKKDYEDSMFTDRKLMTTQSQLIVFLITSVCEVFGDGIQEELKLFEEEHYQYLIEAKKERQEEMKKMIEQNQRLKEAAISNSSSSSSSSFSSFSSSSTSSSFSLSSASSTASSSAGNLSH